MSAASVWNTPVSLSDWGLVFAHPTKKSEFDHYFSGSYFLTQFTTWDAYEKEIAADFTQLFAPLQSAGLTVYAAANLRALCLAAQRHRCVVVIAHCESGDKIELGAELIKVNRLAYRLPKKTGAIYDYSVCRLSSKSFETLKRRSPKSGIVGYTSKIDARASINYVGHFLSQFIGEPVSYARAELSAKKKFLT